MSLIAGSRFGPYQVIGLLGNGGMGEVYGAVAGITRRFAIMPNGSFIGFGEEPEPVAPAYVVLNWSEELKKRIPATE